MFLIGDLTFVQQKAPDIFAAALSSALQLPELKMSFQRSKLSIFQEWGAAIKNNTMFAISVVRLVLKYAFTPNMLKAKSLNTRYEQMWSGYHQLIVGDELSSLWHNTLERTENPLFLQQFMQLVTRRVMDEIVKTAFVLDDQESASPQDQPLKAEEEQALRYVAGYIPMKLKKKYEKHPNNERASKYFECLNAMNEETGGDCDVDFLQYTKLWVEQVNRGGLFRVSDDAYLLFREMELISRRVLSVGRVTSHPTLKIQQELEEAILKNPSIAAHWNTLLTKVEDLDLDSDESDELLGVIVDKWVKIRGHSFASGWVEQYQIATKQSTKKKGLRKTLQQSASSDLGAQT